MYERKRVAINVDIPVKHALNDMTSLCRAELPAERVVEHCIYRYFGVGAERDLSVHLGYGKDAGYLTDVELENYNHDVGMLEMIIQRLIKMLDPYLRKLREFNKPPEEVLVTGLTAYLLF